MRTFEYILINALLFFALVCEAKQLDSLFIVLSKVQGIDGKIRTYIQIIKAIPGHDSILLISERALQLCKKENDERRAAVIMGTTARALAEIEQYDEAIEWSKKGVEISKKINNDTLVAKAYWMIGFMNYTMGDYDKAAQNYYEGIKFAERSQNKIVIASLYSVLGLNFCTKRPLDLDKGLEYYFKGLDLLKGLNAPRNEGFIKLRIGAAYINKKKYKEAEHYLDEALALGEKYKIPDVIKWTLETFGGLYRELKDHKKSLAIYLRALQSSRERDDVIGMVSSYAGTGAAYLKLDQYKDAMLYADSSADLCVKNKIYSNLTGAWKLKSLIYEAMKDNKNALNYYKKNNNLKDSLFKVDNNRNVNELEKKYQTEKKEKELTEKRNELLLQKADNEKQQTQRNFFILGTVILLGFSIFIFRSLKQKQRATELIEAQKREVEEKNILIEEKQKEILDSIHYAKRIQQALMTHEVYIDRVLRKLSG